MMPPITMPKVCLKERKKEYMALEKGRLALDVVRNIFGVPKALVIEVGYVGEYIHNVSRQG